MSLAPDFCAPIVAWRTWRVLAEEDGFRLVSAVQPTLWEPRREMTAQCLARRRRFSLLGRRRLDPHDAPHMQCTCGIYATKGVGLAGLYAAPDGRRRKHAVAHVIGLVSLWGRVLACRNGWRSELAYPARIFVPEACAFGSTPLDELAFSLADYGVPIEIIPHAGRREVLQTLASVPTAAPL